MCPALFDLGERAKVVVMSVTEGEDKPLKYPHVFRAATAMVLTRWISRRTSTSTRRGSSSNARQVNPALAGVPGRGDQARAWPSGAVGSVS